MKTITIECRQYDEWDEAVQATIREKHYDINTDHNWHEYVIEQWAEKLLEMGYDVYTSTKKFGTDNINISFSGFGSQGDGASFTGQIDVSTWIRKVQPETYSWLLELLEKGACYVNEGFITRHNHHYVHERSTSVQLDMRAEEGWPPALDEEHIFQQLEEDISAHHLEMNRAIYDDLYKEYEYLSSEEALAETFRANEYEFDAVGNIRG